MNNNEKKIELMIVGAQKAGTTSLFNYLKEHPSISGHISQELSYFIDDNEYNKEFNSILKKYYENFSNKIIIAKNAGLYVNEDAIKRLYNHNPECKIIYILREPVSRTISSFLMEKNSGWCKKQFSDLPNEIKRHEKGEYSLMYKLFINQSLYLEHLNNIYKYFTKNNVQIFFFEDLKANPLKICKEIFKTLNIDYNFKPNINIIHNKREYIKNKKVEEVLHKLRNENNLLKKSAKKILPYKIFNKISKKITKINKTTKANAQYLIDDKTKEFLIDYYKPFNYKLSKFINIDLSFWNK